MYLGGRCNSMVGKSKECPKCKARLRSNYVFCNQCGHRFLPGDGTGRNDKVKKEGTPHIVLDRKQIKAKCREDDTGPLPRRTALIVLLTLMAVVPMTPWLSVFDGVLTVPAYSYDYLFGGFLTLLALVGAVIVLSDHIVKGLRARRYILAGLGIAAFVIVLHDYLETVQVQMDTYSSIVVLEPGFGLYLAFVVSIALTAVALMPASASLRSVRPNVTYAVRPGSPGSGP